MSTYEEFCKPAPEVISAFVDMIADHEGLDVSDVNAAVWVTVLGACNLGRDTMVASAGTGLVGADVSGIWIDARAVGGSLYVDWHGEEQHGLLCNRPADSELAVGMMAMAGYVVEAINV